MRPSIHRSERGAVLVHVAIALLGLLAMSTFVIDYGVLWAARRQAQNAADGGALAGAISLAFVDFNNQALARQAALDVAGLNNIWGEAPDVGAADVTFPPCPPGSPGAGTNSCVRVNVFRSSYQRAGGNPLPTFFGRLVGIDQQGVRATATAEALFGNTTNCVKPFAIPDKWAENRNDQAPAGWSENDTFERYTSGGVLLSPADVYQAGAGGTGFSPESVSSGGGDYGRYITLKSGNPGSAIQPGWYHPVVLSCPGGNCYRDAIANCDPTMVGTGDVLDVEPGNMVGPTRQGINDLINRDPSASWDPDLNGPGRGGVSGGCMQSRTCALSPRVMAVPVFDPDAFDAANAMGRTTVNITKVIGVFVDRMQGNEVKGYITNYPTLANSGMGGVPGEGFVVSVAMVR